ncbi:MAG: hypothetical protein WC304_02135 [Candidatus Gracilibacteria bacterium]|jgi:hypothetical protein
MRESSPKEILAASNLTIDDLRKRVRKLMHQGIGSKDIQVAFLKSLTETGYNEKIIQAAMRKLEEAIAENRQKKRKKYKI